MTRKVLELFKEYNIPFQMLTKGGYRAKRDFDLYKKGDAFASTLTFLNNRKSLLWEPKAAIPFERINTLKTAHDLGIETWASLEPVIDPLETLAIIENTHEFIDLFKVGTLNYNEHALTIDWIKFRNDVVVLLNKLGKKYYLKKDLLDKI